LRRTVGGRASKVFRSSDEVEYVADKELQALRGKVSIVGIGYTPITRASGRSPLGLAVEAILNAVADAGLSVDDIDGFSTFHVNDSAPTHEVASTLGLRDVPWFNEEFGGGNRVGAIIGQAALAVATGAARNVVVYRAMNGRSGKRMGASAGVRPVPGTEVQYQQPYGFLAPSQAYAFAARAHMLRFGTTEKQIGTIAVQQRSNAALNPRAQMRTPITMADYLASRPIAKPFRLLDCCLESDGACAIVITRTDRAADLRHKPVTIQGWAATFGPDDFSKGGDLTSTNVPLLSKRLYSMAGVGPEDIDVAEFYDAFSFSVLVQLEDWGFCKKGEGGPFLESGAAALGGSIPVNTHGGFLSEGYIHGLNHVCEAVDQLRGNAGPRQVPDPEVALSTSQPGYLTGASSAIILARS
jgi:acetyl-CoA acetyltransferase